MIASRHFETQSEQVVQAAADGCVASTCFIFIFSKAPEMGPSNSCMFSITYSTQSPVTLFSDS